MTWSDIGVMITVGKSFVPGLATRMALVFEQLSPSTSLV